LCPLGNPQSVGSFILIYKLEGNARVAGVIEAMRTELKIFQKVLDRIAGPTLYKEARVIM
jgi:hypothetical protein